MRSFLRCEQMTTYNISIDLKGNDSMNPDRRVYLGIESYATATGIFACAVNEAHRAGHRPIARHTPHSHGDYACGRPHDGRRGVSAWRTV